MAPSRAARRAARRRADRRGITAYFLLQTSYLATLAVAARLGEGAVTLYAYAFFAALLLVSATGGAASIVLAGTLTQTWDRRPETLEPFLLSVTRAGLLLALPALAAAAVIADALLQTDAVAVLPAADGRTLVTTLLCLWGLVAFLIAGTVPLVAAFTQRRRTLVAMAALLALVVHVMLTLFAASTGRLELLALAASSSQAVFLAGLLVTVYGKGVLRPAGLLALTVGGLTALGATTFGAGLLLAELFGGGLWRCAGVVVGASGFFLAVRRMMPRTWLALLTFVTRRPGSGPRPDRPDRQNG